MPRFSSALAPIDKLDGVFKALEFENRNNCWCACMRCASMTDFSACTSGSQYFVISVCVAGTGSRTIDRNACPFSQLLFRAFGYSTIKLFAMIAAVRLALLSRKKLVVLSLVWVGICRSRWCRLEKPTSPRCFCCNCSRSCFRFSSH